MCSVLFFQLKVFDQVQVHIVTRSITTLSSCYYNAHRRTTKNLYYLCLGKNYGDIMDCSAKIEIKAMK